MPNTVIIGAQWGDEGKGKIIDVLTRDADIVVRYQGGNNAGHTVKVGDELYVLHLLPSGVLYPDKTCIIGNGLVADPLSLVEEINDLRKRGIALDGRLLISDRTHAVLLPHKILDERNETNNLPGAKIGTTKRGIGPAYGDKASRLGIRYGDLVAPGLEARLHARFDDTDRQILARGGTPPPRQATVDALLAAARTLAPYITDTIPVLQRACADKRSILFEGAQGTMLDIDFGSYPFVTSSNATSGGACTGTGVPPNRIDRVVGVIKAYTTRVGEGPFPTELCDATGEQLRTAGNEFGATTGRPRRCGWFDAVVARYAAAVNGVDFWAMTKLDVLDAQPVIRVCVAYQLPDGSRIENVPASADVLRSCQPVYEDWPGWLTPTNRVTQYKDLPEKARRYVERLCELTRVKLGILSVGRERDTTLRIAL